jgi:pilus assembly protein CpaB
MRLGSKAKLTIGVGLVAAVTFGFLGVRELGKSSKSATAPIAIVSGKPVQAAGIVLATTTRAIRIGETITADMISNSAFDPTKFPAAATPAEVIGRVATRDIAANVLIPREALQQESKLAIRVPVGMRAISIDTTAEIAVAGMVRPGDKVDVQVVYPGEDSIGGARGNGRSRAKTLLQLVSVLAVGDLVLGTPVKEGVADSVSEAPPVQARTVTLALTPQQVSELSLAKSTGSLYLSLRNPEDGQEVDSAQIASSPEPSRAMAAPSMPVMAAAPRIPPQPTQPAPRRAPPSSPIELVVGGNREVIYSGSGAQ